jgi:hypothetical protein
MKSLGITVGLLTSGAGVALLIVFLATQGLERASWWAIVITLFLTIALLVIGIWTIRTSSAPRSPTVAAGGPGSPKSTQRTRRFHWLGGNSGSLRQKGSMNVANTGIMDHVENVNGFGDSEEHTRDSAE